MAARGLVNGRGPPARRDGGRDSAKRVVFRGSACEPTGATGHAGRCAYGSKLWDDMRKKRLKRAYGSKAWDDMYAGSGRSGRSGTIGGGRRVTGFELRSKMAEKSFQRVV